MTTITAAFDSQPNPNHITMIGAMPTIGTALTMLPRGSSPRCRNGTRSVSDGDDEPQAAAHGEAGEHRFQEGLLEIRHSMAAWATS